MDIVKFFKNRKRMCDKFVDRCEACPLFQYECNMNDPQSDIEDVIKIVEQWTKNNPERTMIQDFFEKFPNAPKEEDGTPLDICPSYCGYTDELNSLSVCENFNQNCLKCWSRPLEQEKE